MTYSTDLRYFSATEAACTLYPGEAQADLRDAFCQGAALCYPKPDSHASDCALHNGPPLEVGGCDCGVDLGSVSNRSRGELAGARTKVEPLMYCGACGTARAKAPCHKCGGELFEASEGWEEPELPPVDRIRELAREVGYAVGVHGSQERDLDLIAAPWTEGAVSAEALAQHIAAGLDGRVHAPEARPLGRWACNIQIDGWYKLIDLSVAPSVAPEAQPTAQSSLSAEGRSEVGEAEPSRPTKPLAVPLSTISEGWRPIETAPDSGKVIVFGGRYGEPTIVEADGEWWRSGNAPKSAPTHWAQVNIPAPPAPSLSTEGGEL